MSQNFSPPPLKTKIGNFTRDISLTGLQAITGIGFKPKAIIVNAGLDASRSMSWCGFSEAIDEWCVKDDPVSGGFYKNDNILIAVEPGSTTTSRATLTSLDSDGFSLTWAKVGTPTGTARVSYLAIG